MRTHKSNENRHHNRVSDFINTYVEHSYVLLTIQVCTDIHLSEDYKNRCVHKSNYVYSLVHVCHLDKYYYKVYLKQQLIILITIPKVLFSVWMFHKMSILLADKQIKIGTTYLYLTALKNFRLLITIFAPIFMA